MEPLDRKKDVLEPPFRKNPSLEPVLGADIDSADIRPEASQGVAKGECWVEVPTRASSGEDDAWPLMHR